MYWYNRSSRSVSQGELSKHRSSSPLTPLDRGPLISVDQVVSDFDGVTFHLSTPESKSKILISIAVKCYSELVNYGAQQVLEREYGPYIVSPEIGYDFSVLIDLENLPDDPGTASIHLISRPWLTSLTCRITRGSYSSTFFNETQRNGSALRACVRRLCRPTRTGVEIHE